MTLIVGDIVVMLIGAGLIFTALGREEPWRMIWILSVIIVMAGGLSIFSIAMFKEYSIKKNCLKKTFELPADQVILGVRGTLERMAPDYRPEIQGSRLHLFSSFMREYKEIFRMPSRGVSVYVESFGGGTDEDDQEDTTIVVAPARARDLGAILPLLTALEADLERVEAKEEEAPSNEVPDA